MDVKSPARRRLPRPALHLPPGAAWLARETYGRMDLITRDDVVLDLGACCGTFAARAAELGAHVVAVEPDPVSFRWLEANTLLYPRVLRLRRAVDRIDGAEVLLWRDPTNAHLAMHSTVAATRKRNEGVPVKTVSLVALMQAYRPSVVKVDIEGGEYHLDLARVLGASHVRLLYLEFTLDRPEFRAAAPVLWQSLLDAGFTPATRQPSPAATFGRVSRWTR